MESLVGMRRVLAALSGYRIRLGAQDLWFRWNPLLGQLEAEAAALTLELAEILDPAVSVVCDLEDPQGQPLWPTLEQALQEASAYWRTLGDYGIGGVLRGMAQRWPLMFWDPAALQPRLESFPQALLALYRGQDIVRVSTQTRFRRRQGIWMQSLGGPWKEAVFTADDVEARDWYVVPCEDVSLEKEITVR